jgi:DNA-directed RNA polymerase specialized sigma24 family protein
MFVIVLNKLKRFLMSKILNILAKRHNEWIRMASSFKISDEDANEIVQEMYLRMHDYVKDVNKIMYNDKEINTFYIYITLRNIFYSKFLQFGKAVKNKKIYLFSEFNRDDLHKLYEDHIEDYNNLIDNYEKKIKLDKLFDVIDDEIDSWYWYDKKMTKLYFNTKMSMRDISKETKISLSSIFNTLTNAKEKIRKRAKKEYQRYKK